MVLIEEVRASNAQISTALPSGLVAVFVGGTNGVGEATLKQFARHAKKPRVYFLGRSPEAGKRILAECKAINPEGEFTFIAKELSLIRNVDEVCKEIKSKEKAINLLFLTIGTLQSGLKTKEGLHYAAALVIHCRNRFITNLLPLIQNATTLRRVVNTFLGTMEGEIKMSDFQGWNMGLMENRGHGSSIGTLTLEHHVKSAPEVSFIHNFPGPVKSGIARGTKGFGFSVLKVGLRFVGPLLQLSPADAGDRHVFLATSARFPARKYGNMTAGVPLTGELAVARGTDGNPGSGVYSIDLVGEPAKPAAEQLLARFRKEGMVEKVWSVIEHDYVNITGTKSG